MVVFQYEQNKGFSILCGVFIAGYREISTRAELHHLCSLPSTALAAACHRPYDGISEDWRVSQSEVSFSPGLSFRSSSKLELGASHKGTPIFEASINAGHLAWHFGIASI